MLQKIKSQFREVKDGKPGRRFVAHHERSKRREGDDKTSWRTLGYIVAGVVLLVAGFALSLPPGVPGFLLWIPGLALLAASFRGFAKLLDRLELWGRQVWQRLRTSRHP